MNNPVQSVWYNSWNKALTYFLRICFTDDSFAKKVADIKGLSHSYGGGVNRLFEDSELFVERNDRIAVLGSNGSGKSTLLRLLIGRETPDEGTAEIVGQNIVMNYFEQNQADALDLTLDVMETIQNNSNGQSYNELRALLGQFLFKGDAVEKKVANLSGGEKARLSLCCMMLEPANLLILDEPVSLCFRFHVLICYHLPF